MGYTFRLTLLPAQTVVSFCTIFGLNKLTYTLSLAVQATFVAEQEIQPLLFTDIDEPPDPLLQL